MRYYLSCPTVNHGWYAIVEVMDGSATRAWFASAIEATFGSYPSPEGLLRAFVLKNNPLVTVFDKKCAFKKHMREKGYSVELPK